MEFQLMLQVNEYVRISATVASESLKRCSVHFALRVFLSEFFPYHPKDSAALSLPISEFLRPPTDAELRKILSQERACGLARTFWVLDCTHWIWKNCPLAWAGQLNGKRSIIIKLLVDSCFNFGTVL
jgi:hypothetical protein